MHCESKFHRRESLLFFDELAEGARDFARHFPPAEAAELHLFRPLLTKRALRELEMLSMHVTFLKTRTCFWRNA